MEATIYNTKGEKVGTTQLSEKVFGLPWNGVLVGQVLTAEQARKRRNTAHTKGRGEVAGGGRKPWRQKGTGRARHGSIRSPLWTGGGVTHGPTSERIYEKKVNKKMRRNAVCTVLSAKANDNEVVVLDAFSFPEGKTKGAASVFQALASGTGNTQLAKKGGSILVLLPGVDAFTFRAVRNLPNVEVSEARNINLTEVLSHKFLMLPKPSLDVVEKIFTPLPGSHGRKAVVTGFTKGVKKKELSTQ